MWWEMVSMKIREALNIKRIVMKMTIKDAFIVALLSLVCIGCMIFAVWYLLASMVGPISPEIYLIE